MERAEWSVAVRRSRFMMASLGLGLAALTAGCESFSQDLNDFTTGLLPPSPTEAVAMAVDQDADKRRRGTLLLANSPFGGNPPYLALYRDHVRNEPNPLVKAVSIRALAKHGAPDDATFIAPLLTHDNLQVRWEAAKGLQRLHQPRVIQPIIEGLLREDEHTDVRIALAGALGQYPEDRVFQALVAVLDDRSLAVNVSASSSLTALTGVDHGLDSAAWYAWYNAATDPFAAQQDYLYPTYDRPESWLEQLAFWSHRVVEYPAPPAGLEPQSQRRTYDDTDETSP